MYAGGPSNKLGVIHFGKPIIQLVRKECVPKAAGEHYWKINSQCHIECWGQADVERSFGAKGKRTTLGRRKGNVYSEVLSWSEGRFGKVGMMRCRWEIARMEVSYSPV